MAKGIGRLGGWLRKLLLALFVLLVPAPILLLLIFRVLPVPGTPEMLLSLIQGKGASYSWSGITTDRAGTARLDSAACLVRELARGRNQQVTVRALRRTADAAPKLIKL